MATRQINSVLEQIRRLADGREASRWTDRQLLDRFINKNEDAAFTALVRRHGPMVMSLGWRILRDGADADDVFQAAFLVLARKARSIRKQESIGGWLYRVAFRLALRVRAKTAKRGRPTPPRPDASPADLLAEISWREVCTALDEELARLPDRCRAPLVLCYLEGKTQDEAQHLLGWSKSSFRRRLEEGRTKLHRRLTRRGITLSAGLWATLLTSQEASAAVLSALARSTVQLAIPFAAGELPAAASPHVILLAKGAVKTAVIHKMKLGAILGIVTAITTGMGLAAHQALTANHAPGQPGELVALAHEEGDQPKPEKAKQARPDLYGDPLPEGAKARLGTVRFRHGNGASVAFSPSGKTLLTCGGDRTIRTWDPVTGQLLRELKLPPQSLTDALMVSPDARLLAFPEKDARGFVCLWNLWDVEQNRLRHKFSLDEGWSYEAIFSPDSKNLITAQKKGDIVRIWDVVTGQSRILGRHEQEIRTFSFAADGTLMTTSKNGTIRFWDLANAREGAQWTAPENVVGAVLSPDGQTVATWSWHDLDKDKGVEFWDAATGEPKRGWIPPNLKMVRAVRFTPEGKEILVSTGQGVTIWDPTAGKSRYTIAGPQGKEIAFSPDGRTVAALGALDAGDINFRQGSVLFVWDLASGKSRKPNAPEHGHLGQVDSLAFSPDGKTIASSSQHDRTIRLWETDSGRLLWTIPISDPLSFHSLTFAPNGRNVLHGTSAAIVRWDVSSRQETSRIQLYEDGKEDPQHLLRMHLTEDGETLLAASQNLHSKFVVGAGYTGSSNAFQAWNLSTGGRLRLTVLDADPILFAYGSFSPDGRLLVAPSGSIFDTASGKEVLKLSVEGMSLGMPVAISRDGAYVAQSAFKMVKGPDFRGTENIGVQIWELATLLPVARLETGPLAHVAFTLDNRRLITAGPDALKLWDISSAKVITRRNAPARFRGSYGDSFVSSMALAPDGNTVATGHVDSTILLWDLVPPSQHRPVPQLRPDQLTSFWSDLASTDASRAFVAITRLAEVPEQTVGLLRDRLRPVSPPTPEDLGRLIAGLNNPDFTRREAATKQLTELGDLASGALRKALNQSQPLEARRRIEALLASPPLVRTNEARRSLRAIRVLERIGTPEAKQALEALTHGAAESKITQEAKGALDRLTKRPSVSP
jgi:RNA polymerase sigma factor (sigma-70 family)